MKQSTERILTTHAGSLPRPADLLEMHRAKQSGQPYDNDMLIKLNVGNFRVRDMSVRPVYNKY